MRLSDLIGARHPRGGLEIAGLTAESGTVEPGFLFAALPGANVDGRDFIADAVARGAAAVLGPVGTTAPDGVAVVEASDPRRALALAAARLHPDQPSTVAAVTGSNGKTSVVWFLEQIWRANGLTAASMGTLGATAPGGERLTALTTPDPVVLHQALARMAANGIDHLAMEASSHGLDQRRLDGVRLSAVGFTNLSRDHLDYHGDMDRYAAAKARLARDLAPAEATCVANLDDPLGRDFADLARGRGLPILDYGAAAGARLRLIDAAPQARGLGLRFTLDGRSFRATPAVIGDFQAGNLLCALGLAIATGLAAAPAARALNGVTAPPGRMEPVGETAAGGAAIVDYAHTPDALARAAAALRPHVRGRLVCLFGCGGDRDPGKRPLMAAAAARAADALILTDDNPRSEDPAAIRAQTRAGAGGADLTEIGDRAQAIAVGLERLGPGDVLLIAGKGHETGQIVGDQVLPFDDRVVARAALASS